MDVDLAWDITIGDPNQVILALLDYGIMPNHEDIVGNLWVNTAEDVDNPPFDDDMNGCKDDINGCNVVSPDPNNFNGNITEMVQGHGHSVMGVMAARGNTIGVSGVMRQTRVMVVKMQGSQGSQSPVTVATNAVEYATEMGADIINASWSLKWPCSEPCAPSLREAIEDARDHEITFVTVAHNQTVNVDSGDPNHKRYPCNYDLSNIICVAATDLNDNKVSASNWGATSVDLAAPGNEIWTLKIYNPVFDPEVDPPPIKYHRVSQGLTSLASPMVAGIVGLMRSKSPDIPVQLIRSQLLDPNSLDDLAEIDPNTGSYPVVTGGRANAYKTLADHDANAPAAITNLSVTGSSSGSGSITINWTSTGDDGLVGRATLYQVRTSTSTITAQNWLSAKRAGNEPVPASSSGVPQSMTVSNLSPNTIYNVRLRAFDEWGNGPLSNQVSCKTQGSCTTSFCLEPELRCTYTGSGGCNGCCGYACVADPTCVAPDPCPENACGIGCF